MATNDTTVPTAKELFSSLPIRQKFFDLLGEDRAPGFITSVLQSIAQNKQLAECEPNSIYNAAATAASMDLPINNNLGLAYIVPYRQNKKLPDGTWETKVIAQFQMGYKGFKQLALRTNQFAVMHSTDVREGEVKNINRLTGQIAFEWIQDEAERESKRIVGYVSFFQLVAGFESTFYMSIEKVIAHAKKYSQSYNDEKGRWKLDQEGMALKTVTKLNLSKNAPLTIHIVKALRADQGLIMDADAEDVTYPDNNKGEVEPVDKALQRILKLISDCKTVEEVQELQNSNPDHNVEYFKSRITQINEAVPKEKAVKKTATDKPSK